MDLNTAIAILLQQTGELNTLSTQVGSQAYQCQELIGQENSIPAVDPQIHAITANMNICIQSIHSTLTIVQQAVDRVAELSNT